MALRSPAKKIAVIGAGPSGLNAIKCCLDEGLEPVCFEKTDVVGGLWYYRDDRTEQSCVFKSTVINTSKETMCFSDFPIPDDWPNFLHNRKVLQYFEMYADHFGVRKYIRFKTKVNSVNPAPDFDTTGRWTTSLTKMDTGITTEENFDAVLVCSGHHCTPNIPDFEGLKQFSGQVMHTHDYLDPHKYADKRIIVVGIGNSGADAAVELGRVASQLFLSTRSGAWIWNRLSDRSRPYDLDNRVYRSLPAMITQPIFEKYINKRVDHKLLGLQPTFGVASAHPTVNDDLPNCIMNGNVVIRPNVRRFTTTGVVFEDGTIEDNIDLVVLATGYKIAFPFLPESVLPIKENVVSLYKYIFPPDHKHPTLAVIGLIQPIGPIFPVAELQIRWAVRVFKSVLHLPSKQAMWENINKKREAMARRYKSSPRHTIQVDAMPFMDEIAEEIGVKPNWFKLFLTDPVLAYYYVFGPFAPYHYRIVGPNQWSGAKDAMMNIWKRVKKPLKTRAIKESVEENEKRSALFRIFLMLGILAAMYLYILYN